MGSQDIRLTDGGNKDAVDLFRSDGDSGQISG